MSQVVATLQQIRAGLKSSLKERESLVDGVLTALLAKEPLFVLGPPGTAKTLSCEALCAAIGGNYFSWAMNKFTTPEELFGPLSIQGLQSDKYIRITTDKLPECHIAFLDEGFKASSAILNTLLGVTNERVFYNNGRIKIPLQTIFVASNEIPQGDELSALYDRMVLRYVVEGIKDEDNMRDLISQGGASFNLPHLSLQDLEVAQIDVLKLQMASDAIEKMIELRRAVNEKGIYVSDRKWMQAVRVVKAFSFLSGHTSVEVEDLMILENVLWSQPDQIPEIRSLVRKLCNPVAEVVGRHVDASNEVMLQVKSKKIEGMEAFRKIKASKEELEVVLAQKERQDVREAVELLGKHIKSLSDTLFKAPPKK